MRLRSIVTRGLCVLSLAVSTLAVGEQQPVRQEGETAGGGEARNRQLSDYKLGPGDEIVIMAIEAEEIADKPIRIGLGGVINLPMVGRVPAAGMTVQELETEITQRLKMYIRQPEVSINVAQFRSQPVTVIGAVGKPGVVQLEGRKSLLEVLSMAGGTSSEASSMVSITRAKEAKVPEPGSSPPADSSPYSVVEVDLSSIIDGSRPERNIQILAHDVITVPRAPIVYALGQVNKQGGYIVNERERMSILQLVAKAGGVGPLANAKASKIIRPVPGSTRIELPVNLKDILAGKAKDVFLQPEDILYVPDSYLKSTLRRTLDTTISITTGLAIYR
jgi:polysaccharide export outer membrane protein